MPVKNAPTTPDKQRFDPMAAPMPTSARGTPGVAPGAPQDQAAATGGVAPGFVPPTIQPGGVQFGPGTPATTGTATAAPGMAFAGLAKQGAATPGPVQPTQPGKQARPRNPFNIGQPGVPFGG